MTVEVEKKGPITIVTINRPEVRNCVNRETQMALAEAWESFDRDPDAKVGIMCGKETGFCAGADLKGVATGQANRCEADGYGSMGPSRMLLSKPVIGAITGHAVAGGLELALWCDMRIAEEDAVLGVFCRRWGVPLIDGGTVRLPRIVGLGRALDMILTGRPVGAEEALAMGLVNRVVPKGEARAAAEEIAEQLIRFPQVCMNSDRLSAYEQAGLSQEDAIANEFQRGLNALEHEAAVGAAEFAAGKGRGGSFSNL